MNMSTLHTEAQLYHFSAAGKIHLAARLNSDNNIIADVYAAEEDLDGADEGNAERLVACWNAFYGVPTEIVKRISIADNGSLYYDGNSAQHWAEKARARGFNLEQLRKNYEAADKCASEREVQILELLNENKRLTDTEATLRAVIDELSEMSSKAKTQRDILLDLLKEALSRPDLIISGISAHQIAERYPVTAEVKDRANYYAKFIDTITQIEAVQKS